MKNKQKTLYEQCYQVSILPNMFCALVLLSYSILIINVDVRKYWGFVLVVIVMILIAQFVLCPITHRMFIGKASRQIEEMEKVIPEKIKDPLENSRYIIFGKSLRREIARIYYNAGYRKIDDDCAVITKDELKQYKVQALKEFAENLKECAKSCKKGGYDGIDEEDIDLILKDYEE